MESTVREIKNQTENHARHRQREEGVLIDNFLVVEEGRLREAGCSSY